MQDTNHINSWSFDIHLLYSLHNSRICPEIHQVSWRFLGGICRPGEDHSRWQGTGGVETLHRIGADRRGSWLFRGFVGHYATQLCRDYRRIPYQPTSIMESKRFFFCWLIWQHDITAGCINDQRQWFVGRCERISVSNGPKFHQVSGSLMFMMQIDGRSCASLSCSFSMSIIYLTKYSIYGESTYSPVRKSKYKTPQ